MKKILFAALALVALNACVKDELDPSALTPPPVPEKEYDYTKLVLNELSGAGEDNEKFIELYNKGTEEIDLEGVVLHKDEEECWEGKKGMVVPAGGVYAIIGAKNSTDNGFSSGFSAKKTVIVELFAPAAKGGAKLDTFQRGEKGAAWGAGLDENTGSWSRIPDGTGAFMITPTATPGALNNGEGATADPTLVGNGAVVEPEVIPGTAVLNELSGAGEDNEKFFELYNPGDEAFDLEGVTINKDEELTWTGKAGESIPAKGFFAIIGAKNSNPDGGFSSGFSAKKTVIVELFGADGNKLDTFQRGDKGEGWGETITENTGSWSRIPDGTGAFKMTPNATPGAANNEEDATDDELVK